MGKFLASPIRKLFQNPNKLLTPYLRPKMKVLEVGPGMGFFTLPLAKMVGSGGKVYAVDLQEGMLLELKKRVAKAGLEEIIVVRQCSPNSLKVADLINLIDLAIMIAVVHEVPDKERLFKEVKQTMKIHAKLLLAEPRGHVTESDFKETLTIAKKVGLVCEVYDKIALGWVAELKVKG
jgi:ubiquinone/menaquinone biosynthesis C-methylase UbiE